MTKRPIFNPLFPNRGLEVQQATASAKPGEQAATAAIYNMDLGTCPKCHTKMTTGVIANSDSVFFCEQCRVATPFEDSNG